MGETKGNIEFDVPQCENGTLPEDCIYEQSTVMYADGGIDGSVAGKMSIPYTVGHLHVAISTILLSSTRTTSSASYPATTTQSHTWVSWVSSLVPSTRSMHEE